MVGIQVFQSIRVSTFNTDVHTPSIKVCNEAPKVAFSPQRQEVNNKHLMFTRNKTIKKKWAVDNL